MSGSTTWMRSISSPNSSMRTAVLVVGGVHLDGVAPHPELAPHEVHVVALVAHVDELAQDRRAGRSPRPTCTMEHVVAVLLGRAEAVDARHRRHHDHVAPGEQRRRGRVAQPVDLVVHRRVLLDVGVARRRCRPRAGSSRSSETKYSTRLSGKNSRNSLASWAASDLLGASTSVGRCTCSIVQAMVALLPEPVMPSSVWNRSPRSMPSASAAMAFGWSPAGCEVGDHPERVRLRRHRVRTVPTGCDIGTGRSSAAGRSAPRRRAARRSAARHTPPVSRRGSCGGRAGCRSRRGPGPPPCRRPGASGRRGGARPRSRPRSAP